MEKSNWERRRLRKVLSLFLKSKKNTKKLFIVDLRRSAMPYRSNYFSIFILRFFYVHLSCELVNEGAGVFIHLVEFFFFC